MTCKILESETHLYWRVRSELSAMVYAGRPPDADLLDELDLIAQYTKGPTLRRLCTAAVCQFTPAVAVGASV